MSQLRSVGRLHVGFVSTRFNGTDGVSLETAKWADVLAKLGHTSFFFAGEYDGPPDRGMVVPEASFHHPSVEAIGDMAFSDLWGAGDLSELINPEATAVRHRPVTQYVRPPGVTHRIHELKDHLKDRLRAFVEQFEIDLLVVQNALAIPMNIPLGLALTEYIAETGTLTIAHHHDFYWERKRFLVNCIGDYLAMSFPPNLPSIRHVAINSSAASQLGLRTGIAASVIPNVMDFDNPPPPPDEYVADLRASLGVPDDSPLVLQPTRVVQRKGIEHAIELCRRLGLKTRLVISHASGDEGDEYEKRVRGFAEMLGVTVNFEADVIRPKRGRTESGRKIYALGDVYSQADLVTYPSDYEGFGNAFLEAIYYRRPLVVNNYSIYAIDIRPRGFQVIEFDGFISDDTVRLAERVLSDPQLASQMGEHNYRIARRHFSYDMLSRRLTTLLADCFGEAD